MTRAPTPHLIVLPAHPLRRPAPFASLNGRSVSLARWNKPFLLQKATLTSDTDATPVAAFVAPDWINVARNGSNPTTWNTNMKTSTTNTSSVIGLLRLCNLRRRRIAQYKRSRLSFPCTYSGSITSKTIGRKGPTAGFADLSQTSRCYPTSPRAWTGSQTKFLNNIVGWRNYSTAAATGSLRYICVWEPFTNIAAGTPFFSSVSISTPTAFY